MNLKNLRNWFVSKDDLIKEIGKLNLMLDIELEGLIKKMESLEQNNLYIVELKDCSNKELQTIRFLFKEAAKRIKWSVPPIFLIAKTKRGSIFASNYKKQTEVIKVERFNFFKPAYSDLLNKLGFGKLKIMECVKVAGMNEGHIRIVLEWWASKGILTVDKSNKEFEVELTSQGKELVKKLNEIKNLFDPKKEEVKEEKEVKENADATESSESIQSGE